MNPVSALQGTRMGRQVKTEEEALLDARASLENSKPLETTVLESEKGKPELAQSSKFDLTPTITAHDYGWQLSGLELRGRKYVYTLSNQLIDGGAARSDPYWITFAQNAFGSKTFIPAAADVIFAIVNHLGMMSQDPHAGYATRFLRDVFTLKAGNRQAPGFYSFTSYNATSSDKVVHDLRLPCEHTIEGKLSGEPGSLRSLFDRDEYCRLVFGHAKAEEVIHAFCWPMLAAELHVNRESHPSTTTIYEAIGLEQRLSATIINTPYSMHNWPAIGVRQEYQYPGDDSK